MLKHHTYIWYVHKDDSWLPIYVGKGKTKRSHSHLKADTHVGRTLRKYPTFVVVIDHETNEQAIADEIALIAHFGRADLGKGSLLNLTPGGDGLKEPSAETRIKMRNAKLGKSPANKGKPASDEQRERNRAASLGKTYPPRSAESRARTSKALVGRPSGQKGVSKSEEAKANMRKPKSEKAKANMRKPKSAEARANMAQAQRNRAEQRRNGVTQ